MALIRGIVAAPVLPMAEDFEIDWTSLRDYLRWLAPQGPIAIAMNMDAAEGPSLSVEERLRVIEVSRPPLMPISDDERRAIRRLLVHAGLLPA